MKYYILYRHGFFEVWREDAGTRFVIANGLSTMEQAIQYASQNACMPLLVMTLEPPPA